MPLAVPPPPTGGYDEEVYGATEQQSGYVDSIAAGDEMEEDDVPTNRRTFTMPKSAMAEVERSASSAEDPFADTRASRISDRESDYQARRRNRIISPERHDPFADDGEGGLCGRLLDMETEPLRKEIDELRAENEELKMQLAAATEELVHEEL